MGKKIGVSALIIIAVVYLTVLGRRLSVPIWDIYPSALVTIFIFLMGFSRYKSLINPITLLLPIQSAYVGYNFYISMDQQYLSQTTILCFYLFIIFYVFGAISSTKTLNIPIHESQNYNRLVIYGVVALATAAAIAQIIVAGGATLLVLVVDQRDAYSEQTLIPIIHYFVLLSALAPAVLVYLFKKKVINILALAFLFLISSLIILNTVSRQLIILSIICIFLVFSKDSSRKEFQLSIIAIAISTFMFIVLGEYRISAITSGVTSLEYLKSYSGVTLNTPVNVIEVTFNLYTSMNFSTLDEFVRRTNELSYGSYVFRPILDLVYQFTASGVHIASDRDTFSQLATAISDPYLDFGVIGVAFFAYTYGYIGNLLFRTYKASNLVGVTLLWGIFCYVMVMAVFANFFNVLFIWLCVGLSVVLIYQPGRREFPS